MMLDHRRQYLLFSFAGLCLLLALLQWVLFPVQAYRQELKEQQVRTLGRLQELQVLGARLQRVRGFTDSGDEHGLKTPDFTLFSYLEKQATLAQIKDSVEYMRPLSERRAGVVYERVQMRLEPIRLTNLTNFLAHVEQASEDISIQRMTITSPRSDPGRLRVDVVFSTSR
mgnify:FL=1